MNNSLFLRTSCGMSIFPLVSNLKSVNIAQTHVASILTSQTETGYIWFWICWCENVQILFPSQVTGRQARRMYDYIHVLYLSRNNLGSIYEHLYLWFDMMNVFISQNLKKVGAAQTLISFVGKTLKWSTFCPVCVHISFRAQHDNNCNDDSLSLSAAFPQAVALAQFRQRSSQTISSPSQTGNPER